MNKVKFWPITAREQPAGKARTSRIFWPVMVLLILPLMTHAVFMTMSVLPDGLKWFGRLDLLVFLVVIAYACLAIVAVAANYAPQLLLSVYSTLIALVVVEGVLVVVF